MTHGHVCSGAVTRQVTRTVTPMSRTSIWPHHNPTTTYKCVGRLCIPNLRARDLRVPAPSPDRWKAAMR